MKKKPPSLLLILLLLTGSVSQLLAAEPPLIRFRDMYGPGMVLANSFTARQGKNVEIQGFMAPPLKPDASFFILTKMPMAVCPFCDNEADWPEDVILVKLDTPFEILRFNRRITVQGKLSLGVEVDQETGFVSRVRLLHATFTQEKS